LDSENPLWDSGTGLGKTSGLREMGSALGFASVLTFGDW